MWGSIYWENLRGYQDNACMEKRILFRLLSGLHSSIMTQIANLYRFDGEGGGQPWVGILEGGHLNEYPPLVRLALLLSVFFFLRPCCRRVVAHTHGCK